MNGVKHIRSSPYHPASNGAAERLVQSVKQGVWAGLRSGVYFERALQAFLMRYRITPHATTGQCIDDGAKPQNSTGFAET